MKILHSTLLSTLFSFLSAAAFAQNGLVAWYQLNGSASDSIGTNHGVINGAVPTTDRFGATAAAYSFAGTTSRIDFAVPPINQATSATVCAWVKPGNFTQTGIAVYLGADNGVGSDGFGFGLSGSSALQGFDPYTQGGFFGSGYSFANTSQWVHVAMVRSGGDTFTFFVNGIRTPSSTLLFAAPPTDFTIGGQNGVRYFKGAIDDVRIYNRALTSNEVSQLFAYNEICTPHAARATPVMFNGFVVGATITDSGCGYTSAPPVTIVGGGGSNATATATISGGLVTSITIQNPGCCYTNPPTIVIGSPPFVPTVSIGVSKVKVTQHVMVGRKYVLESSTDLVTWNPTGPPFSPQSETVVSEFDSDLVGRYFRLQEVP